MTQRLLVILVFLATSWQAFTQSSLEDYSHLVVPKQFEFTKGKDAFRLNTLTRYRLRQMGFNAVWEEELPDTATRCDVAYVDAESSGGFINTKVNILVRDCNNMTVFYSHTGTSKEKVYEVAYREAFEEALESFIMIEEETANVVSVVEIEEKINEAPKVDVDVEMEVDVESTESEVPKESADSKERYTSGAYQITKMENTYILYKDDVKIGSLTAMSQKDTFLINSSEVTGIARKTDQGFEAEVQLAGQEQLSIMKFETYDAN